MFLCVIVVLCLGLIVSDNVPWVDYLGELETAMDMFDSALDTDPGLRKCQSAQDLAIAVDEAKNHGKRLYSWRDYAQALSFYEVSPEFICPNQNILC